MTRWTGVACLVGLAGLVGLASLGACSGPHASPETLPDGAVVIARFGEARALDSDGAGRLYVADAARSTVIVLDTAGALVRRLGGTDRAFLDVSDVDPTNGQAIFVADAGTGRIVRFTAEGRAAETIDVPDLAALDRFDTRDEPSPGRPIAVGAGPGNEVYVLDSERNHVLRWAASRQLDRLLGRGATGAGARLASPTALAVTDAGSVVVADGARAVVFGALGGLEGTVPAGGLATIVNVSITDRGTLYVGADAIREADEPVRTVELGEALVDATRSGAFLYVLTRTRLIRLPG